MSYSEAERLYHIGRAVISRHRQHIRSRVVQAAHQERDKLRAAMATDAPLTAGDVRVQLSDVVRRIDRLLRNAEARAVDGLTAEALKIPPIYYRELRETMRLLAEVEGRIAPAGTVTLSIGSVWLEVREIIMLATEGYPAVRDRIAAALIARGALPSPEPVPVEPEAPIEAPEAEEHVAHTTIGGPQGGNDPGGRATPGAAPGAPGAPTTGSPRSLRVPLGTLPVSDTDAQLSGSGDP
jgi:hypothetical protein